MSALAITSAANPRIKAARALWLRKTRQESGLFLAEGLKIIGEALAAGRAPKTLIYAAETAGHPIFEAAAAAAGERLQVSPSLLAKISKRDNPQLALGVFEAVTTPLEQLDPAAAPAFIALEGVRDPGNLGAIVRTADAAGAGAVVLVGETCDPFSVEAVRATMGSIFAVPIARASRKAFLSWRVSWPGAVVGTSLASALDYRDADWRAPVLALMGAEQSGLTPELATTCDVLVKIPMRGRADSLNLAVAAGIVLYRAMGL
ncbi:MAG TPA: RNA methyltransferase [Caulobacteraceae bacterium]|nr:RNA methyltransferase [Caulobacteraceae bacterium]